MFGRRSRAVPKISAPKDGLRPVESCCGAKQPANGEPNASLAGNIRKNRVVCPLIHGANGVGLMMVMPLPGW
jgi:hypothetical protein